MGRPIGEVNRESRGIQERHPPDRGEDAQKAQAPETVTQAAEFFGSVSSSWELPKRKGFGALTFDWNVVIALETREPRDQAAAARELVALHNSGKIEVALSQASAIENSRGSRTHPPDYDAFVRRVAGVGLQHLPRLSIIIPALVIGWHGGQAIYGGIEDHQRALEIGKVLFGENFDFKTVNVQVNGISLTDVQDVHGRELATWRNRVCDVLVAESHIRHERQTLVTMNVNDFRPGDLEKLVDLGLAQIRTPVEALFDVKGALGV